MSEIIYNQENKKIQFSGYLTSFKFYHQLFSALATHYKCNGKNTIPSFSFNLVDEFDAAVIPNLIGLGLLIKRAHKGQQIDLEYLRINSTKFLESTMFFNYVGPDKIIEEEFFYNNQVIRERRKIGFDIFKFNSNNLGFYNNSTKSFDYNKDHKIHVYDNISYEYYKNYNEIKDKDKLEEKLDSIRTKINRDLEPKVKKHFSRIIKYNERPDNEVKTILKILTELICNSILYSYSPCIALLQSKSNIDFETKEKRKKTYLSISDIGIGLAGSFQYKPNFKREVTKTFQSKFKKQLENYLLIFDALHYSKEKNRENLYTLLKLVINSGGKMRIHYDNVQVVFTTKRCFGCEVIPNKCAKCLLDNFSTDPLISPIRFLPYIFKGIHIEVELDL